MPENSFLIFGILLSPFTTFALGLKKSEYGT